MAGAHPHSSRPVIDRAAPSVVAERSDGAPRKLRPISRFEQAGPLLLILGSAFTAPLFRVGGLMLTGDRAARPSCARCRDRARRCAPPALDPRAVGAGAVRRRASAYDARQRRAMAPGTRGEALSPRRGGCLANVFADDAVTRDWRRTLLRLPVHARSLAHVPVRIPGAAGGRVGRCCTSGAMSTWRSGAGSGTGSVGARRCARPHSTSSRATPRRSISNSRPRIGGRLGNQRTP